MNRRKIIFYDIDGTLVNFDGSIPDSTRDAIRAAKENGHKQVICTGRSRNGIPLRLQELGFDGFVCASGAYVEVDGTVIFHDYWEKDLLRRLVLFYREHGILFQLQSGGHNMVLEEQKEAIEIYYKKNFPMIRQKKIALTFCALPLEELCRQKVEKSLYFASPLDFETVKQNLSSAYEVTGSSFEKEVQDSGEITKGGIHKAFGMQQVLARYGMGQMDSVAYGDGPNDYEMLEFAGIGVAMGNAVPELKKIADRVTDRLEQNGIYNSLTALQLIKNNKVTSF